MYDYLLGNGHSLAADRRLADALERVMPDIRIVVRLGRTFLRCAMSYLMRAGVRQFLDFGSAIPPVGNVHEIAHAADPSCRVAYVDTDPIAVAHGQISLAGSDRAVAIQAGLCDPADLVGARRLLDPARPVGLLMVDVLRPAQEHRDPTSLLARCANRFRSERYLVIAQLTGDHRPAQTAAVVELLRANRIPVRPRTRAELVGLFAGFELIGPGVCDVGQWYSERPLDPSEKHAATQFYVGVGRKLLRGKR